MDYQLLGRSGLRVSDLCLGTMPLVKTEASPQQGRSAQDPVKAIVLGRMRDFIA
jgi:aryl-alcohol dehydrogenase-like predicted oxidoreductase